MHGIGFRLLVANPYHFEAGEQKRVYVQLIIRDNDQTLYGFEGAALGYRCATQPAIGDHIAFEIQLAIVVNVSSGGLATRFNRRMIVGLTVGSMGSVRKQLPRLSLIYKGKIMAGN